MKSMTMSDMKSGLLAYYPLKGNADDYSGKNSNASATAEVTYNPGIFGSAATFAKLNAVVKVPQIFPSSINSFTISAWISLNAYSPVRGDKEPKATITGGLIVQSLDGAVAFNFTFIPSGSQNKQTITLQSNSKLQLGVWTNITVVFDQSASRLYLYYNGQLDSQAPVPDGISPIEPVNGVIGASTSAGNSNVFNGLISDVSYFKIALTQVCISTLSGYMTFPVQKSANNTEASEELAIPFAFVVVPVIISLFNVALYQNYLNKLETEPSAEPTLTLEQIAARIKAIAGAPVDPSIKVTRQQIGIDDNYSIKLDVGGMGVYQHNVGGIAGLPDALNLNDKSKNPDSLPPDIPIPYLVLMPDWRTNPTYPFDDGFADYIIMQSSPLTPTNVQEINRVLKIGGSVGLWIDQDGFKMEIAELAKLLNCNPLPCTAANGNLGMDEMDGKYVYPKILLTKEKPMSNPGTVTVKNDGGYIARFSVEYSINGKQSTEKTGDFPLGTKKSLGIPSAATDIILTVEEYTGFSWNTIFTLGFGAPVIKCYKIWGTTFGPSWEEVKCSDI